MIYSQEDSFSIFLKLTLNQLYLNELIYNLKHESEVFFCFYMLLSVRRLLQGRGTGKRHPFSPKWADNGWETEQHQSRHHPI